MQASAGAQIAGRYGLLILTEENKASPIRLSRKTHDSASLCRAIARAGNMCAGKPLLAAGASLVIRRHSLIGAATDPAEIAASVTEEAQMLLALWQEQAQMLADKRSEARPRQIFAGLPHASASYFICR